MKNYSQDPSYGVTNNLRAPGANSSSGHGSSVDKIRGRLNSSIPLYSYSGKEINLPISLNYSATGVRVNQIAENTGLGWNLSFGGTITRYVNIAPDDQIDDSPSNVQCGQSEAGLSGTNDYYKMNIMGTEEVFRRMSNLNIFECVTNSKIQTQVIGQSVASASNVYWIITLEDGTKLYFGENNTTNKTVSISQNSNVDCSNVVINSTNAWHITKIISKNKLDEYLFTYTPFEWLDYITEGGEGSSIKYGVTNNTIYTLINSQYKIKQMMINEIYHNTNKIVGFVYSNRSDMNFVGGTGNKLDEILYYNYKSNAINGKVGFSYSYFGNENSNDILDKRLKLDDINFYGVTSEGVLITENNFHFEYKDPYLVPQIDSFARDYLGLYNGKNNNINLITNGINFINDNPPYEPTIDCNPPNSNRSYDFEKSLIGTLTSISNPTKGKTVFEYEQNAKNGGYGQAFVEESFSHYEYPELLNFSLEVICPDEPERYRVKNSTMSMSTYNNFPNNPYSTSYVGYIGEARLNFFDLSNRTTTTLCDITTTGDGVYAILKLEDCGLPNNITDYCEDDFVENYYGCAVDTRDIYYTGTTSSHNFVSAGLTQSQPNTQINLAPGKYQVVLWNINYASLDYPTITLNEHKAIYTPAHLENLDVLSNFVDGFRIKSITNLDKNDKFISKKKLRYNNGVTPITVRNFHRTHEGTYYNQHRSSRGYYNAPDIIYYRNIYEINLDLNDIDNGFLEFVYDVNADVSIENLYHYFNPIDTNSAYLFTNEKYDFLKSINKYDVNSNLIYQENFYYDKNLTYLVTNPSYVPDYDPRFYFMSKKESYNYINPENPIYLSEEYEYFVDEYNKLTTKQNEFETVTYEYNNQENYYYLIDSPVTDVISTTKGHSRSIYSPVLGQLNGNPVTRYLTTEIQSSKPNESLEPKTRFEYDTDGNMVSTVQVTPGTIANNQWDSFIYGYDNRFVVAKLTGIKYSDIPPALIDGIDGIKAASNQAITPASITAMETALNALRNSTDVNVQNAQITTYTYNPVFGVTSVTDPRGMTIYTEYDAFGRVKLTKEKAPDGSLKILSENQYNTRPD